MEEWTLEGSGRRYPQHTRVALFRKNFRGTSDGVLDMLREVKTALRRYQSECPCSECRRDRTLDNREPPMKRIKLQGLECLLQEICGNEAQQ